MNTVTVSDTIQGTLRFAILEYAGIAASSPLDVTAAAQGSGTNPSSGSVATTASGDSSRLGAVATSNSPGFGAGRGYTIEESVPAAPGTKLIAEDAVQTAPGSAVLTATLLASGQLGRRPGSIPAGAGALTRAVHPLHVGRLSRELGVVRTVKQPRSLTSSRRSSRGRSSWGVVPGATIGSWAGSGRPGASRGRGREPSMRTRPAHCP